MKILIYALQNFCNERKRHFADVSSSPVTKPICLCKGVQVWAKRVLNCGELRGPCEDGKPVLKTAQPEIHPFNVKHNGHAMALVKIGINFQRLYRAFHLQKVIESKFCKKLVRVYCRSNSVSEQKTTTRNCLSEGGK